MTHIDSKKFKIFQITDCIPNKLIKISQHMSKKHKHSKTNQFKMKSYKKKKP